MSTDLPSIHSLCEGLDLPESVRRFEDAAGGEVVFGVGKLASIGEVCRDLGAGKALIVTDPGIAQTGCVETSVESLRAAGVEAVVFDEVHENPTTLDVDACVKVAKEAQIDLIIGLGGGSSMDTAKGCNFILTNGGTMHDYWGVGKATQAMLPFVAIPTTSGTGSECQSFALIADAETHAKMACGDVKAAASVAILDPTLTLTMPALVTAVTGIDAIAHALETAVCRKRTEVSSIYSAAAWQLLDEAFGKVIATPDDLTARSAMQLGAAFAGTAIENSMLGIAHSCANPLTAHYGLIHGQAVGAMLPHVIRFNQQDPTTAEIYQSLFDGDLAQRIEEHLDSAGLRRSLSEMGVEASMLPQLAEEAAGQWTAQFNPVEVSASSLLTVYETAF